MIYEHGSGSGASTGNEIPACCGETSIRTTEAISIKDWYDRDMIPTVQRRKITISEWNNYDTSTHIYCGIFVPAQFTITAFTAHVVFGCSLAFCVLTALKIHFVIVIATLLFMCYVIYMLLLTALTEPGFLPKNKRNPVMFVIDEAKAYARNNQLVITVQFAEKVLNGSGKNSVSTFSFMFTSPIWGVAFDGRNQFVVTHVTKGSVAELQGVRKGFELLSITVGSKKFPIIPPQDIGLRYCWSCKIARPERSKHCNSCDACVQKFDHHCPWTGTCIGSRNYTYFVRFVSSLFALIAWVLVWTLANISGVFGDGEESPGIVFFGAFLAACIICVGGLGCYHLNLIRQDRTTAESLRGEYRREGFEDQEREDRNGHFRDNCRKLCMSSLPPSAIASLR